MSNDSMFWGMHVKTLVKALDKHEMGFKVDKNHFYDLLMEFSYSSINNDWIYSPVDHTPQASAGNVLSLDGLIMNGRAQYEPLPKNCTKSSIYSAEALVHDIVSQEELVRIIRDEPHVPFSLLARFQYVNHSKGDRICTMPLLIKPGINPDDERLVYKWEVANIYKELEHKLLNVF